MLKLTEALDWLLTNRIRGVSTDSTLLSVEAALGPTTEEMLDPHLADITVRRYEDIEVAKFYDQIFYIQVDITQFHLVGWQSSEIKSFKEDHPYYALAYALSIGRRDAIEQALKQAEVGSLILNDPEHGILLQSGVRLYWDNIGEFSCIVSMIEDQN